MRRQAVILCVLAPILVAGCGPNRHHQLAVASSVVAQSLFAVQDSVDALAMTARITPAQSQRLNGHLVVALTLGKEFNRAVRDWNAGEPVPAQLTKLKAVMLALAGELTAGYPDDVKAQLLALINATYDAIVAVLLAGGT
jgi:hypothetical protein